MINTETKKNHRTVRSILQAFNGSIVLNFSQYMLLCVFPNIHKFQAISISGLGDIPIPVTHVQHLKFQCSDISGIISVVFPCRTPMKFLLCHTEIVWSNMPKFQPLTVWGLGVMSYPF